MSTVIVAKPPHDSNTPLALDVERRLANMGLSGHVRPVNGIRSMNEAEKKLVRDTLRGLWNALREFLGAMPVHAQNGSGLARLLNIERTTCQRVVSATTGPFEGLDLVARLPGVKGLRLLVEATRKPRSGKVAVETAVLDRLERMIDEYDSVVRRAAGSRSRLIKRITAKDNALPLAGGLTEHDHEETRRRLFEAATTLTGRCSETWLSVSVYEPIPERNDKLVVLRAHGLVRHVARHGAVPLTFHVFEEQLTPGEEVVAGLPTGRFVHLSGQVQPEGAPEGLLPKFSSRPLPLVCAKELSECFVQMIDPESGQGDTEPVDVMFGLQGIVKHPASRDEKLEEVWALVNFPARQLVFDVYLHQSLARASIASLDTHLWRPDFVVEQGERWQTRFTESPRLELLGTGLSRVHTPAYPRYQELLQLMLSSRNLNPDEYVGYRCSVAYPAWRCGYCISFDFAEQAI